MHVDVACLRKQNEWDFLLSVRWHICSATMSGSSSEPLIKSVPATLASKTLQLFLSRCVVLMAIFVKMFKTSVNGDTSRLITVIDISMAKTSMVRRDGRHFRAKSFIENDTQLLVWFI